MRTSLRLLTAAVSITMISAVATIASTAEAAPARAKSVHSLPKMRGPHLEGRTEPSAGFPSARKAPALSPTKHQSRAESAPMTPGAQSEKVRPTHHAKKHMAKRTVGKKPKMSARHRNMKHSTHQVRANKVGAQAAQAKRTVKSSSSLEPKLKITHRKAARRHRH